MFFDQSIDNWLIHEPPVVPAHVQRLTISRWELHGREMKDFMRPSSSNHVSIHDSINRGSFIYIAVDEWNVVTDVSLVSLKWNRFIISFDEPKFLQKLSIDSKMSMATSLERCWWAEQRLMPWIVSFKIRFMGTKADQQTMIGRPCWSIKRLKSFDIVHSYERSIDADHRWASSIKWWCGSSSMTNRMIRSNESFYWATISISLGI